MLSNTSLSCSQWLIFAVDRQVIAHMQSVGRCWVHVSCYQFHDVKGQYSNRASSSCIGSYCVVIFCPRAMRYRSQNSYSAFVTLCTGKACSPKSGDQHSFNIKRGYHLRASLCCHDGRSVIPPITHLRCRGS